MILLVADINPVFSKIVILSMMIIVAGFIFSLLKQPSIISYILVGILVGPHAFGFITDGIQGIIFVNHVKAHLSREHKEFCLIGTFTTRCIF